MAQTMAMGQAAGVTAALAALGAKGAVRDVPVQKIRQALHETGAILDLAERVR
jgi:hypothetical protein